MNFTKFLRTRFLQNTSGSCFWLICVDQSIQIHKEQKQISGPKSFTTKLKFNSELSYLHLEAATRGVLLEKVFLEISQNSYKNTCARVSFLIKLQAFKKDIPAQVFSSEFCEISKNTFFTEHLWTTAS